jgi:RNA polymerase sigma factor (TIGR02999 family)
VDESASEPGGRAASGITALLLDLESGRPAAWDRLVEVAYPELHRIAHWHCSHERSSATLQCTAIVHEAWIRLAQAEHTTWKDRAHFFAFASRLMRSILIDYARARKSMKRGGGVPGMVLIDTDAATQPPDLDILELNEALQELEKFDALQGRIVELRYFSGLSIPETAEAIGISESTVKREWIIAKTWIRRRMLADGIAP